MNSGDPYSTVDCFRPPRITILCSRLNRKPSTQILDPKNLRSLLRKNLVSNLAILGLEVKRFIFDFFLGTIVANSLYDLKDQYSPRQMTLRKVATVNNNSFGAYAIQMGLDKFLIGVNHGTSKEIQKFKAIQIANQHRGPNEVMKFLNLNFFLLYY